MVTGTKVTTGVTPGLGGMGVEAGRRRGDLSAHRPFLSTSPQGNRVGISFRRSHFALWKRGRVSHFWLSQGERGEEDFQGKELVVR